MNGLVKRHLTVCICIVSDALMKALASGKEGFAYLGRVLIILLQTLLQDEIAEVSGLP